MDSHQEQYDRANLALFLGSSLGITNKSQLEDLLLQPSARTLVRSAPYQDIFLIIKTVGLADSLELLPLTSKEQRCGFIDLDCWRKDSFQMSSLMEWLAAFMQCGPEETVRMARAVDANLLSLFLKENIVVYALEPDDPPPDLPLTFTPDHRFGIEITGETEGASISRLLLDALFRFDPPCGYDLIDRAHRENRVSLEEEAYQNKRRRLEEIGFVDYYDALDIYGERDIAVLSKRADLKHKEEDAFLSATLPALLVASLAPGHYLREALLAIHDRDQAEKISQNLAALANRLLSAHSVTPGDLEKVPPTLEEMRDTLSLSLEYLTQGQKVLATNVLQNNDIRGLFKTGFNLIANLRSQADLLLTRGGLRMEGVQETLLEFPEEEFFSGLRRQRPLFFEGLEDPGKASYRNFRTLADIEISKKFLNRIETLAQSFWKLFKEWTPEHPVKALRNASLSPDDLGFSQIFNTALINLLVENSFQIKVLTAADLREFLKKPVSEKLNESQFAMRLLLAGQCHIAKAIQTPDEKTVLFTFAERWTKACADELVSLFGQENLEPRFLRTLLVTPRPDTDMRKDWNR